MKKSVIIVFLVLVMCSSVFAISIKIDETKDVPMVDSSIHEGVVPEKLREKVTRHVYGLGHVADITNGEITYLHQDRLGSTRVKTDSEGEVVGEFKSLPFGQEIVNDGVRYSFATGKELDSSGLYYFGARYYDPNIGRFTTVDPVPSEPAYAYVGNNPMNMVDPSGMAAISWKTKARFVLAHPNIAKNYFGGGALSDNEKKIGINWFSNHFRNLGWTYASKYMDMYIDPGSWTTSRAGTYATYSNNPRRWGALANNIYRIYDATSDMNSAGFKVAETLSVAKLYAKNPAIIRRTYESGQEALLVNSQFVDEFVGMRYESMGEVSFYIQKGENGMATLTMRDLYDWDKSQQATHGGFSKQTGWCFYGCSADSLGDGNIDGLRISSKGAVMISDYALEGLGQPYVIEASWQISEKQLYGAFGWK
jgi:RHS repeat-associated protein